MNDLIENIDKVHTTAMGEDRICKNLSLQHGEGSKLCKSAIRAAGLMMRMGKNWYVYHEKNVFTVNAKSHTVITAHKISGKVREIKEPDYPCLKEFLYQAIYLAKGEQVPSREIVHKPDLFIYIKDFGAQRGDLGVVAEQNGQIVGAAWTRIIPSYGHVDTETPQLAISILPEFRACGIGAKLMKKLFELMKSRGFEKTSLSVQKENPAVRFYQRLGYTICAGQNDSESKDYLMIKIL